MSRRQQGWCFAWRAGTILRGFLANLDRKMAPVIRLLVVAYNGNSKSGRLLWLRKGLIPSVGDDHTGLCSGYALAEALS